MPNAQPLPSPRNLVLLGGGHAHALVVKKWATDAVPGARLTLIDPQVKAPYTGMLPGFVAGHYARSELDIDLHRLTREARAQLITDAAVGLDAANKRVRLANHPDMAYDTLSIDIGITSGLAHIHGAKAHLIPAKPLGPFADAWADLLSNAVAQKTAPRIAILGAGVAGVELALAMAHRIEADGLGGKIQLIEKSPTILQELSTAARRKLVRELERARIDIVTNAAATAVSDHGVLTTTSSAPIPADFIVSAAGAAPHRWLQDTGLVLEQGYIAVDETLRSTNTPSVFAAGDCAHLTHAPRPKAGVFAVRQAPVLHHNLCADLANDAFKPFVPQRAYLKLISTGRQSAVTDKWGVGFSGPWVWTLKNRIDQAFMEQFRDLGT